MVYRGTNKIESVIFSPLEQYLDKTKVYSDQRDEPYLSMIDEYVDSAASYHHDHRRELKGKRYLIEGSIEMLKLWYKIAVVLLIIIITTIIAMLVIMAFPSLTEFSTVSMLVL